MSENINLGLEITNTNNGSNGNKATVIVKPKDPDQSFAGEMALYLPLIALFVILVELLVILKQRKKLKEQSIQILSNKKSRSQQA